MEAGLGPDEAEQSSLIPGLPDDISLSCLARVPRKYHAILKCVSKQWRDLICSEEWYAYRKKHHLGETWIYALCRDKFDQLCCYVLDPNQLRKGWKRIQGLPCCCLKRKGMGFEVLGKKLYLFGGCGWIEDATSEVYCYDAAANSWSEAAPLSVARCYFTCQAVHGKIFAIGGLGPRSCNPHSWETYDPQSNCWHYHLDSNFLPDIDDSVLLDGKIYVRCSSSFSSRGVVYDPTSGTTEHADPDMVMGWKGPAVVVNETLYVLNQTSGTRLTMWQKDVRQWVAVRRFSSHLTRPPCRLVAIGKNLFIIGKDLSTVVFEAENAGNTNGVSIGSSVTMSNSDAADVISCKSVSI